MTAICEPKIRQHAFFMAAMCNAIGYNLRASTQISFSNFLCFSLVPISIICDGLICEMEFFIQFHGKYCNILHQGNLTIQKFFVSVKCRNSPQFFPFFPVHWVLKLYNFYFRQSVHMTMVYDLIVGTASSIVNGLNYNAVLSYCNDLHRLTGLKSPPVISIADL